jgi:hypothetical protein
MFILKIMGYNFELKRAKKFFLIAVVITLIAFIITCIINPDFKVIMDRIENSHQPIKNSIGINKVWSYIVHNGITVPMQMVILTLWIYVKFLDTKRLSFFAQQPFMDCSTSQVDCQSEKIL